MEGNKGLKSACEQDQGGPLSTQAFAQSEKICNAILCHPFIQELSAGTLSKERFCYYIEQDALYLMEFARALAFIAGRSPHYKRIAKFLDFSEEAILAQERLVHKFFLDFFDHAPSQEMGPACLNYTSFILKQCAVEPIECSIASVFPCFWVYHKVSQQVSQKLLPNNIYKTWLNTYMGNEFSESVEQMTDIFNMVAESATPQVREKMLDVFRKGCALEWHFWNDAYNLASLDSVILDQALDEAVAA